MGSNLGIDPEDTIQSKLMIFWGINAVSTNMHQWLSLKRHERIMGPRLSSSMFIKIKQLSLLIGLFLFCQGQIVHLHWESCTFYLPKRWWILLFLEEYTIGHEELRKHVVQYDPNTVSEITGVPVEDIYKLARMYGNTSPSYIRIGNGPQHHDNGGMCVRTISCLPALTGQWLLKGGGAIKSNSGYLAYNDERLQRPDLLKNKDTRVINMNLLGETLLS